LRRLYCRGSAPRLLTTIQPFLCSSCLQASRFANKWYCGGCYWLFKSSRFGVSCFKSNDAGSDDSLWPISDLQCLHITFSIGTARLEPELRWYYLSEPYRSVPSRPMQWKSAKKWTVLSRTEPYPAVEKHISQVIFIYVTLYTIQIVLKQLNSNKQENKLILKKSPMKLLYG